MAHITSPRSTLKIGHGLLKALRRGFAISLASFLVLSGANSVAQASEEEWSFRLTPYIWVPALEGEFDTRLPGGGAGPSVETETDILDVLDFAFLLAGEARYGRFAVLGEFNYLALSADDGPNILWTDADVELDGFMTMLAGAYRVYEQPVMNFDVFAGGRYWRLNVKQDIDLRLGGALLPGSLDNKRTIDWFDPVVGARVEVMPWQDITFSLLGDVGGFGVGSDLQWELVGQAGYSFNETIAVALGYRHLELHPEKRLIDEVSMSGPFLAVSFTF